MIYYNNINNINEDELKMITYEYQCQKCNTEYEAEQRITDEKYTMYMCPECKAIMPCKRIITKTNFILLGSGWAKDDYCTNTETFEKLV